MTWSSYQVRSSQILILVVDELAREMLVAPLSPADVGELLGLEPADALDAYLVIGGFPVLAR